MAKKSSIEKNKHRIKLSSNMPAAPPLEDDANNEALTMEERFAARLKLAELRAIPPPGGFATAAK